MNKIFRSVFFALFAIILGISGCTAPCNYPDQRGVIVRIINAMPDVPMITVFINGKMLAHDFPYYPPNSDLYLTGYADGTQISAGDSSLFVVTSDIQGIDTVARGIVTLNFNRQTVIVMGRGHIKPPMKKTSLILRLDDQSEQPNGSQTLIRFVNAVPDLDSLDIYFKADTIGKPLGKPDTTIHYGKVYPHLALTGVPGIIVTEAGHPNHVIFSFPNGSFFPPGIYITAIIRGESNPLGTDYTAAPLVLSDVVPGIYLYVFKTFFIRTVNATRSQQLSLLIRSTYVTLNGENTNPPRNNYPGQDSVLNINSGSVSTYIPMNINNDSIAGFWFSKTTDSSGTVASSIDHAEANIRYSKIAVEDDPVTPPSAPAYSYLNLPDTMTNPAGNFGRVRVINLSPDHSSITVSLGSRNNVAMAKKQVEFFDVPLTNTVIMLTDGSTSKSYTLPVSPVAPISVYLLPEQPGTPSLPILTSTD